MKTASRRPYFDRLKRRDLASGEKKVFKKPSLAGGIFFALIVSAAVPAGAEEARKLSVEGEREELVRMLREMRLPPAVSYANPGLPVAGPNPVMKQYDVEESPRKK